MDELEFRRRAYANPNDTSPDFISAVSASELNRQFVEDLQRFDHKIAHALHEPVPEHLPRLLLRSPLVAQSQTTPALGWRHLAIAASITFVLGFSTRFISFPANDESPFGSMGQVAMEHVRAESAFTNSVDEKITLTAVNAKLKPYGTQLGSLTDVGQVYYANHCLFAGGPAAHLVIQGEHERVHVFLVPAKQNSVPVGRFSDEHYHGEIMPMALNHLVVVSDKGEDVDQMARKISASLTQAI